MQAPFFLRLWLRLATMHRRSIRPGPTRRGSRMELLLQQIINGLVLGSMYALIALGYTMVYGILNLINFAHGDVLMVGALTALSTILFLQPMFVDAPGWLLLAGGRFGCDSGVHHDQSDHRARRLPAAAQRPAPGAVDHGHRRLDPAADVRDDRVGTQLPHLSDAARRSADRIFRRHAYDHARAGHRHVGDHHDRTDGAG